MHRPTISEIEAGRRRVTAEELKTFAELYAVSVEWLTGSDEGAEDFDDRVRLAARELARLKSADLEKVLNLLAMMRKPKGRNR